MHSRGWENSNNVVNKVASGNVATITLSSASEGGLLQSYNSAGLKYISCEFLYSQTANLYVAWEHTIREHPFYCGKLEACKRDYFRQDI